MRTSLVVPSTLAFLLLACQLQPSHPGPASVRTAEAAATPEGHTHAERRELFASAVNRFESGDLTGAEPLLERYASRSEILLDYVLRYRARIAEARGDTAAARALWEELARTHPDSVWLAEASLALAEARFAAGEVEAAAAHLAKCLGRLGDAQAEASARWLESRIARRRGHLSRARDLARNLRRAHSGTASAVAAALEAWNERQNVALASQRAAAEEISLRLLEGDARGALTLVGEARARFRREADQAALALLEARALRAAGRAADSERALEQVRKRYPGRPEAPEALHRLASAAWNRDDDERALLLFDRYVRSHPNAPQASESLYAVGRIHQEAGRFAEAAQAFARLRSRYPKSDLAPEAAWRIGWCEYQAGRYAKASDAFGRAASGSVGDASLYWKARALEKLGRDAGAIYEELLRRHPDSYYSLLAEARTGRPEGGALAPKTSPAPTPPPLSDGRSGAAHLSRFRELLAMDLARLAQRELGAWELASGASANASLLQAWLEADGFREVVRRSAARGGCRPGSPLLSYCYPLAFWDVVRRESARAGVDPLLVIALMRQESLFDPRAISSANARGLMQLLPSTAERTLQSRGGRLLDPADLFDVERNVAIGIAHLRELLDRYEGNEARALAAYNAGAAAVEKWERRYPSVPEDEFVDSISYRETRDYVKKVLRNRRIYRTLYSSTRDGTASDPSA